MDFVLQDSTLWRRRLAARLETPFVQRSLTALILLNAVILGLETGSSMRGIRASTAGAKEERMDR